MVLEFFAVESTLRFWFFQVRSGIFQNCQKMPKMPKSAIFDPLPVLLPFFALLVGNYLPGYPKITVF